jgi:hypothetical protein
MMKIVRFSQNGHAPHLGCYVHQDEVMDLAASCVACLTVHGVVRASAIADAFFPQSPRGFLEGGVATQWRVLRGYATYHRTPVRITSLGKWAPLKLRAIGLLPLSSRWIMEGDRTSDGLK